MKRANVILPAMASSRLITVAIGVALAARAKSSLVGVELTQLSQSARVYVPRTPKAKDWVGDLYELRRFSNGWCHRLKGP